jgi:hypothetical protein
MASTLQDDQNNDQRVCQSSKPPLEGFKTFRSNFSNIWIKICAAAITLTAGYYIFVKLNKCLDTLSSISDKLSKLCSDSDMMEQRFNMLYVVIKNPGMSLRDSHYWSQMHKSHYWDE